MFEPLGHRAKEYDEQFQSEYPKVVNRFSREFLQDFCNTDGEINWTEIVELNSGKGKRQRKR